MLSFERVDLHDCIPVWKNHGPGRLIIEGECRYKHWAWAMSLMVTDMMTYIQAFSRAKECSAAGMPEQEQTRRE